MTPQIESIANQISSQFMNSLTNIKLTPDEVAIVQRVSLTAATNSVTVVGLDSDNAAALVNQTKAALDTLALIGEVHEFEAVNEFRDIAFEVIQDAFTVGLDYILPAIAASAMSQRKAPAAASQKAAALPPQPKKPVLADPARRATGAQQGQKQNPTLPNNPGISTGETAGTGDNKPAPDGQTGE